MNNCLQPHQTRRWPPPPCEVKPASAIEATMVDGLSTTGLRNRWNAVCQAAFAVAGTVRQVACAAAVLAEAR